MPFVSCVGWSDFVAATEAGAIDAADRSPFQQNRVLIGGTPTKQRETMDLNGASIFVTGGCGFIGSTTIDLLLKEHSPSRIVILDNLVRGTLANVEDALSDPRVELIRGDIRDVALVRRAIEGMDAVLHLAALRITACSAAPREALEVMCDGSFNVVEAAQRSGVKRVVAASSASVYGLSDSFPTEETQNPYKNRTWYGAAKVMMEGLLRAFNDMYGLPYVALRYFNVYGPRMDIHGKYTEVLVRWMERIEAGEPPLILGDGSISMDFVDISDVARANVLALASNVSDAVFNVASGSETTLNELAGVLLSVMGSQLQPIYKPQRQINAVSRRLADISKAEQVLGFRASVGLEGGLNRLVTWWRAQKRAQKKATAS
jgi:UDP-glucose 4-epimerase